MSPLKKNYKVKDIYYEYMKHVSVKSLFISETIFINAYQKTSLNEFQLFKDEFI